jgi:hypothetical protein
MRMDTQRFEQKALSLGDLGQVAFAAGHLHIPEFLELREYLR